MTDTTIIVLCYAIPLGTLAAFIVYAIGYWHGLRRGRGQAGSVVINGERVGDLRGVTMTIEPQPETIALSEWKAYQPDAVSFTGGFTPCNPDSDTPPQAASPS